MTTVEFITSEGDSFRVPSELCRYMITISDMLLACQHDPYSPVILNNITSNTFHNIMIWIVEHASNNDCLLSPSNAQPIDDDTPTCSKNVAKTNNNDSDDDNGYIDSDDVEMKDDNTDEIDTESEDEAFFALISPHKGDIDKHLSDVPFWDMSFFSRMSQSHLFNMMEAVNFLNIPMLEKNACIYVAWLIKGKNVEQFRAFFKIRKNFTAAQKRLMEQENDW